MYRYIILILAIMCTHLMQGQNIHLPLYNGTPPNYQFSGEEEIITREDGITKISYVQTPDISVHLPSPRIATGEAVVICPGGGYWILAYDLEGTDIANYFNSKGIAAIILKYRLPVSKSNIIPHLTPLMDAQRAMRLVRSRADEWGIQKNKVGIMGFSAGGHLASTLSTHYDLGIVSSNDPVERLSCKPDFSILIYPVISFTESYTHQGSKAALLGDKITDSNLVQFYSNELQVDKDTPPAILIHASDDQGVPPANSFAYFNALQKAGVLAELHFYPIGGHGFGLAPNIEGLNHWPDHCFRFIKHVSAEIDGR